MSVKSIKIKLLIALPIEFLIFAAAMFIPAGSTRWAAGWAFLVAFMGGSIAVVLWLLRRNPGLLEERMRAFGPGQKAWDKVFIALIEALFLGWLILMPLDAVRFHWSNMPVFLQVFGLILMLATFYPFFLIFKENPFASSAVRVQTERGHTVVSTGPYSLVRHPMYAVGITFILSVPLLLGSWYGVLSGLIYIPLFGVRAVLEEQELRANLKGYSEYMSRVKRRFIPGVW